MKTAVFFALFIVNALLGIFTRHPVIFGFSILALAISLLFSARPIETEKNEVEQEAKSKN